MIAQLVLTKEAIFPEHLVLKTTAFLSHFLRSVDFKLLHIWATEVHCMSWQDLFPVMQLVYSSCCHCHSSRPIDMLCLEVGLLGLQIILNREDERQSLIKQGLLDYLICLPWHICKGCESQEGQAAVRDGQFSCATPASQSEQHCESKSGSQVLWT